MMLGASDRPILIPDSIEPIAAYRGWTYGVGHRFGTLDPIGMVAAEGASAWDGAESGWVHASCQIAEFRQDQRFQHPVPDESCSCGFYAVKELSTLEGFLGAATERLVLGRVLLAGKVIEHELGYRAERARILELIPWWTPEVALPLAIRLGLPLGTPVLRHRFSSDDDPSSPQRPLRTWICPPVADCVAETPRLAA